MNLRALNLKLGLARRLARCLSFGITMNAGAVAFGSTGSVFSWPQVGGDSARSGKTSVSLPSIASARWTLSQTAQSQTIRFVGASSPVGACVIGGVNRPRVFAIATITGAAGGATRLIAVDPENGSVVWNVPIAARTLDSWSSPALDAANGSVIVASGNTLAAYRASDGQQLWTFQTQAPIVNASPLIVSDRLSQHRALISDYGGFGGTSRLYCINLSAANAQLNPFAPGALIWQADIGSATGATPAYEQGMAFIASTGLDQLGIGEVRGFAVFETPAASQAQPKWTSTNTIAEGFFGGVSVKNGWVYAASYGFSGGLLGSNLVKLSARNGQLAWSVPSNRSASMPIVLDDQRIVLSTGINGFGSLPTLQIFQDQGASATLMSDSALSTWIDTNQNATIDLGESLVLGGWNHQPVIARSNQLLIGTLGQNAQASEGYSQLRQVNLNIAPNVPSYVVQTSSSSAGASPMFLGQGVYSISSSGALIALGSLPPRPDVNQDSMISIDDLWAWELAPLLAKDVDRSGAGDDADRIMLANDLRAGEARHMAWGQR